MREEVCEFFSEAVIPHLEHQFPDDWTNVVKWGIVEDGSFFIRLPESTSESYFQALCEAALAWFGEAIYGAREWLQQRLLIVRFQPA